MGVLDRFRGTGPTDKGAPPKAIVAASMPLSGPGVKAVDRGRRHSNQELWQKEAWYFFDAIGEARGPVVWIANAVSQADLHATDIDTDTGKPTGPTDDPRAIAAATAVLGGPAQRLGLLRTLALCWQVPGEAWIIVRPQGGQKPDQWLVLSGEKVRAKGETWSYTDPYNGETITLRSGTDRLIRVWSPHPNDQAKSDSAFRPALPICREVEKASQNIAARLDSRLAGNGAWLVPEEVDYPKGDHETVGAALMDLFLTIAETGIQNPGQAAAQVPIVLTLPGELIGNAVFQDFSTAFDASVVELRQDALRRLAATLDMPKDVAEGTQGEANHWSSWKVEEDTYKIYIEPLLKALGDAITEHWFRPALIAMGMTPEQADSFELGWDTTAIVARPDARETLESLYEKVLISDEYMLTESGVPLDALPSNDERTRRVLEKIILSGATAALLADPNVAEAIGLDVEISPVAAGVDAEVGAGGELEVPEPPAPVVNALPGTQGDEPVPEGLVAAAETLVMQALERVGGRLLTNQNRGQFKNIPRHELHTVIKAERPENDVDIRFSDGVAEAFGVRPGNLKVALEMYVINLVKNGMMYDRDALRWYLR
jgi:hypothetical protein